MSERELSDDKLLSGPVPEFDASSALMRFRDRAAREHAVPATRRAGRSALASLMAMSWARPATAAVGAVAILVALTLTGVADTILTVFEPQRIQTVQVDVRQLGGIPDPSAYGELTWIAQPSPRPAADAAAAAAAIGFTPLAPGALPAGIPGPPRFLVAAQAKATFRFDEAKARAAAAKTGATIPPMPAAIAATTLTMTGGPAVMQQYGGSSSMTVSGNAPTLGGAQLMILQAKAPVVTSNGASVDELRDYALKQPGIPADLAAQIRAIGDPVRTLMLPIGIDVGSAKTVTVRGTQGYLVGDRTGLGSGVVWLESGSVLAVFGTLSDADLVTLVNGLH